MSIDKFIKNLTKLINVVSKSSEKIVLVGLSRIDESKVMPIPWSPTKYYDNNSIEKYDRIIQQVSKENNIPFCPMYDLLEDDDLSDGLHPNAQGHKKCLREQKISWRRIFCKLIFSTLLNYGENQKITLLKQHDKIY